MDPGTAPRKGSILRLIRRPLQYDHRTRTYPAFSRASCRQLSPGNGRMDEATESASLDKILDPVARCFTPAIAKQIAEARADLDTQARIEELAAGVRPLQFLQGRKSHGH